MPTFHYRALTQTGELVSGEISAPTAAEVARRIEYLNLVPIDTVADERPVEASRFSFSLGLKPRSEDITIFTRDLALLLKAGARLDSALELLTTDIDLGRLRIVVAKVRGGVIAGETFADALSHHPAVFPPIYVSLARVGEASGTLDHILEVLATERTRADTLRRRLSAALRYPIFLLFAATLVLLFFLLFVLPQFAAVLRDFNAKLDPMVAFFLGLSDFLRSQGDLILAVLAVLLLTGWLFSKRLNGRATLMRIVSSLPIIRPILSYHLVALFCRNLSVLLGSGVALTPALRILVDMLSTSGNPSVWPQVMDRVRHGGKLSDALADTAACPLMAVRMLRLGEETGQLPLLAARVAEFYEVKLERSLDRIVGIAGPAAIITISVVVGGLIVSVMTSLLSMVDIVG